MLKIFLVEIMIFEIKHLQVFSRTVIAGVGEPSIYFRKSKVILLITGIICHVI